MTMNTNEETAQTAAASGARWSARLRAWFGGTTIQGRLVRNFALVILVPALLTAVVGVGMIRQLVFAQAQTQVNADLEAAKEIYQSTEDRLEDAIRIHATRMVIYGALTRRDTTGLAEEMDRIRRAEHLDVLTLTDADGRVFYRSGNPEAPTGGEANDSLVALALKTLEPAAGTEVVDAARAGAGVARPRTAGGDHDLAHAPGPSDRDQRGAVRHDAACGRAGLDPGRAPAGRPRRRRADQPQLRDRRQDPPHGLQGRGVPGPAGGHGHHLPERRAHLDQRPLGRRHARDRHTGVGRGGRRGPLARRNLAGPRLRGAGLVPGRLCPDPGRLRAPRSGCSTSACSSSPSPTASGAPCSSSWGSRPAAWRWCTSWPCGSPGGSRSRSTA